MNRIRSDAEMEEHLLNAIEASREEAPEIRRIRTYEEVGMLTTDRGLVVAMQDGSEFQITIIQSKEKRGPSND